MAELPPCRNKAMDLLARRSHFRRELQAKLLRRGYGEEEVEATLQRLAEDNLLDDRATAQSFGRERLSRGPMGRRRLMAELLQRGAESDLARETADSLLPEDDREQALIAAQRFPRLEPPALARRLERRGFSRRGIMAAVELRRREREVGADGETGSDGQEPDWTGEPFA